LYWSMDGGVHENPIHGRTVDDRRSRTWWRCHSRPSRSGEDKGLPGDRTRNNRYSRLAGVCEAVRASQQAASGRNLRTAMGKVVTYVGDPPKHVGITEFDGLDQAVAYRNSQAFKDLDPLRNKAIKIVRQYTVEAEN
jgi:hypothetical protein